ncbi:polyphenol oxidase family protein [Conexibacter sp. JD483]|uniref:polyphenol oxidase family protein n=1 Tax=unclassified Conexibacter TaxID=2627773 RepID=UPI002716EA88|nr:MULTISPECIES: polyphenol oxidase family protein [unclassified Conexibacter]MDO8189558.1 polyphenol oxidase family protein [Conexibacter sp. CPCC 205706]MDO8201152.1 polyphenol oxidase family protein [Conexibacter sp. CPCC 205762]MDR9372946.1 polyphenol oxidase family protein [Conexibacter sp. JD483]
MDLPAPFAWQGDHVAIELPGGSALFTTRRGGVSQGPYASLNLGRLTADEPAAVERNRELLAQALRIPRAQIAQGLQVHETVVRRVCLQPDPDAEPTPADGQATALADVAPLVLTADCLPVALIACGAVAMVHAGWRGLAGGVLEEGVRALRELGADGHVAAAIGPGAGRCCYQVGDDVRAAFARYGDGVLDGDRIDLKAIARKKLKAAGVGEVHDAGLCTICSDPSLFFSYRRDGVTGRQAGVAWRS